MSAAEKLIAEHGIHNVTIRNIVSAAGQKNESVLQYHFKNLSGLLDALHAVRNTELEQRRTAVLEALLTQTSTPSRSTSPART